MEQIKEVAIGIDLGTTYCSVTFWNQNANEPHLVFQNNNASSFASYIVINRNQMGQFTHLFGQEAKEHGGMYALFDSKRLIGKKYDEYMALGSEKKCWTFDVIEDTNGLCKMVIKNPVITSQTIDLYPEEVSAMILKELLKLVNNRTNSTKIGKVVVTVPVKFNPQQRNATIRACKIAGIEKVELLNEPTASIIEYKRCLEKLGKGTLKVGTKILVIDFGGGTLDVCFCQIEKKTAKEETKIKVLSTGGDQDLGGKHFDLLVFNMIVDQLDDHAKAMITITKDDTDVDKKRKTAKQWKIMIAAEKAKMDLSLNPTVQIPLEQFFGDDYMDEYVYVSQKDFEAKCAERMIGKLKNCILQVLGNIHKEPSDVDLVLPIGGSCRVPIVRKTIDGMFNGKTKKADPLFDSLSAVANGAAYQAFRYQTSAVDNDDDVEDKLPYGVGIELRGQRMCYHAEKGQQLPVVKSSKVYHLIEDGQKTARYTLYAGDSTSSVDFGMTSLGYVDIIVDRKGVKKTDFDMIGTMDISKSGVIQFTVTKQKNGLHLGTLEASLEMDKLDARIKEFRDNILRFG